MPGVDRRWVAPACAVGRDRLGQPCAPGLRAPHAALAAGRFNPGRVILGATKLYVTLMISFAIDHGLSVAGFVRLL